MTWCHRLLLLLVIALAPGGEVSPATTVVVINRASPASDQVPTAIDFDHTGLADGCRSPGSLTGLTLLAPLLTAGPRAFTAADANTYADRPQMPGQQENLRALNDPRIAQVDRLLKDQDLAGADAVLTDLAKSIEAPIVLYNLACVQALTKRPADALKTLARAVTAGWFDDRHSQRDPDLTALRTDPGWPALITRMQTQALHITPGTSAPFRPLPARDGSPPGRLAIMLGATTGRGLSVDETIANLERSVAADGTRPTGSVWFMASNDEARTGPRRWAFAAAATLLR